LLQLAGQQSVSPVPAPVISPALGPIISPAPTPVISPAPAPVISPAPAPVISPAPAPLSSPPPPPNCDSIVGSSGGGPDDGEIYVRYFDGQGITENTANPGNNYDVYPPQTTTFPGTLSPCDAAQNCADYANSYPGLYLSFDLHLLTSANQWECVAFYNPNGDPSYFNVANSGVALAFGYSTDIS
jgi:hypothetical protein